MAGYKVMQLFTAVNLLAQPCGATIAELEDRLGIKKRQAYRIIEALQDQFKLCVLKDKAPDGEVRYYLEEGQFKRFSAMKVIDLNLSISEVMSLYFLKGNARLYRGTGIDMEIERAFAKLDAFVPPEFGERIDKIKTTFLPATKFAKDYSQKEDVIATLADAVMSRQTCLVDYHSFSKDAMKTFRIDPLHFFERDGGLYLFVRSSSYGDIRVLAVERIERITMSDDAFDYPEDFDAEALLEEAFGLVFDDPLEVKIRFSAEQARYIRERTWAKGQQIVECEDGSIILEMATSGWWDVKRWVLGFGGEAEVLEPSELREEIIAEMKAALSRYA